MEKLDNAAREALAANYRSLCGRIGDAARKAGKEPCDVKFIAAVKYATAEEIDFLHRECGLCDIGENRVNHLLEHWEKLEDRDGINVHFIGTLQSNKVKYIIDKVSLIHSLDSETTAREIERQAAKRDIRVRVLVEINSGREASKGGVMPEDAEAFCLLLRELPHVELAGFMTMAPKCEKKVEYTEYFEKTYQLVLDIWRKKLHNIGEPIVSMGMSDSFEEAICAGATCVRIGGALFGRTTPQIGEH